MYMYYVSVYIYKYTYISDIAKQLMSTHRVCVYIYIICYIYIIYILCIYIYITMQYETFLKFLVTIVTNCRFYFD